MNFLAHQLLSGENMEVRFGNFIADNVRKSKLQNYPEMVQKGILLHQHIDAFTDSHEVVLESKKLIRKDQGKFAPVVIDVFYDHFLAKEWNKYHPKTLKVYCNEWYDFLSGTNLPKPEIYDRVIYYMKKHNWLYNYQYIDGIKNVMIGMANRTNFDSNMGSSHKTLNKYYEELREHFEIFFPDLQSAVEKEKINLNILNE